MNFYCDFNFTLFSLLSSFPDEIKFQSFEKGWQTDRHTYTHTLSIRWRYVWNEIILAPFCFVLAWDNEKRKKKTLKKTLITNTNFLNGQMNQKIGVENGIEILCRSNDLDKYLLLNRLMNNKINKWCGTWYNDNDIKSVIFRMLQGPVNFVDVKQMTRI